MAQKTIVALNQTASNLALDRLSVVDGIVPASSQTNLSDFNSYSEIRDDEQLLGYIQGDQVLLEVDSIALTKAESLAFVGDPPTQTLQIPVRNETGTTISRGSLVSVDGYSSVHSRVLVDVADKDLAPVRPAFGVLLDDIPNNTNSVALVNGLLQNVDTSSFSLTDQLVLGNGGQFSRPPPTQDPFTGEVQLVGQVARVDASNGIIQVIIEGLSTQTSDEVFALPHSLGRGWISGGEATRLGGLNLRVAAGEGFLNAAVSGNPVVSRILWGQQDVAIDPNALRVIYIDSNGVVQQSPTIPDLDKNIVLMNVRTNATDIVWISAHKVDADNKNARDHEFASDVIGPTAITGGLASINGSDPLGIDISSATFYITDDRRQTPSSTGASFTYVYRDGSGGITLVPNQTQIDTENYDDGSGTLAPIPAGEWKKDAVFIMDNEDSGVDVVVVYAQETFTSQSAAEAGNNANPIVSDLTNFSLRTSGVVVLDGDSSITSITDERPFLGQFVPSTGATDHGLLSGLGDPEDHPWAIEHDDIVGASGFVIKTAVETYQATQINQSTSAETNTTFTNTTFVNSDLSITATSATAGPVLILSAFAVSHTGGGVQEIRGRITVNGTKVIGSLGKGHSHGTTAGSSVACLGVSTVAVGDVIRLQWLITGGTASVDDRSLHVIRMGA